MTLAERIARAQSRRIAALPEAPACGLYDPLRRVEMTPARMEDARGIVLSPFTRRALARQLPAAELGR